jgi:hypothetical protein
VQPLNLLSKVVPGAGNKKNIKKLVTKPWDNFGTII